MRGSTRWPVIRSADNGRQSWPRRGSISGYPLDEQRLRPSGPASRDVLTLGFVGRIHEEKGLRLLVDTARIVAATPGLPPWRLLFCGPEDVARGGSGPEFRAELEQKLRSFLPAEAVVFLAPQFDDDALARVYQSIDLLGVPPRRRRPRAAAHRAAQLAPPPARVPLQQSHLREITMRRRLTFLSWWNALTPTR